MTSENGTAVGRITLANILEALRDPATRVEIDRAPTGRSVTAEAGA